jgi:hypothetical protein
MAEPLSRNISAVIASGPAPRVRAAMTSALVNTPKAVPMRK